MKNARNIAINGSMLDEHPTGVGVYTYNIINTLSHLYKADDNRNLTVFTPSARFLDKGVKVVLISRFLKSSEYGKRAAFCRFVWNTFLYPFAGKGFDLLINPTTHGSFTLKNQVITIHDLLSLRYKNINSHQRLYFKYLLPLIVWRSKLIIAVSEATKKDIVRFLKCPPQKVQVVHNGYDSNKYNQTAQKGKPIKETYGIDNYILAVGPTYAHKNFELLLTTYRSLDQNTKNTHPLVIAGGKSAYVLHLKQIVKELHIESHIVFLGYVPEELMPALYKEAFLLVFPSLYEGFGFPLLEAMACGCPVIASNTSSMPEVCEDAAIYFEPSCQTSLSNAIYMLTTNNKVREEQIKKGIEQVKKFSWEKTAEKLKTITDQYL